MEPVADFGLFVYSKSVQKMCRKCIAPTVRFLVIAAPRPSDLPDLDCIQAGLIGGRFLPLAALRSRSRLARPVRTPIPFNFPFARPEIVPQYLAAQSIMHYA